MNNEIKKFLPIGTVVMLKGGKKRLMITGFCMVSSVESPVAYDYSGCPFPEGIVNTDKIILFNHNDIEQIYYFGLRDEEEIDFKNNLNNVISVQSAIAARNSELFNNDNLNSN